MEWTNHKHSLTGSLFKEIILFLHWWRNRLWQLGQGAHEVKGWESEDLNSNVGSASVSILGVLLYHVREPVQMGRGLSQLHYSLTLKGNGHHWPTDAVRQRRPTLLHWHTQTLKLALKMPPPIQESGSSPTCLLIITEGVPAKLMAENPFPGMGNPSPL